MSRPVGSKNRKGALPKKTSRAQLTFTEEDLVIVHLCLCRMRDLLGADPEEEDPFFRDEHKRYEQRVAALIERVEYYI